VVTAVNYGPLLDVNKDVAQYHEIDKKLVEILGKIMETKASVESIRKFAS
jgi:hypothetical protein